MNSADGTPIIPPEEFHPRPARCVSKGVWHQARDRVAELLATSEDPPDQYKDLIRAVLTKRTEGA